MIGESKGKKTFVAELDGLASLAGGDPFSGKIEITAREGSYVLHAEGNGRGNVESSTPFRFQNTSPTFVAELDSSGRNLTLQPNGVHFTNQTDPQVVFTREEALPMRVVATWWRAGAPDDAQTQFSMDLHNPQTQQARIPITLDGDGEWILRAMSYRYDTAAKEIGSQPDVQQDFRVVLDRSAPSVTLRGIDNGDVLSDMASAPDSLDVAFANLASESEAPLDLDWRLTRTSSGDTQSGELAGHDPLSSQTASLDLGGVLKGAEVLDGPDRLEVG